MKTVTSRPCLCMTLAVDWDIKHEITEHDILVLSHRIRKLIICTADQCLCFCYTDSTIPIYVLNFNLLACFCDCTGCFVADLVVDFPCNHQENMSVQ